MLGSWLGGLGVAGGGGGEGGGGGQEGSVSGLSLKEMKLGFFLLIWISLEMNGDVGGLIDDEWGRI